MSNLLEYLHRNGITQAKFADRLGVSQGTVSKLCGDDPKISPALAAQIDRETSGDVPFTAWPQFSVFSKHSGSPSTAPEKEAS